MGWSIELLPGDGILRVTSEGAMDLGAFTRLATEVLEAARRHQATKILVDHRRMVPRIGRLEVYDLAQVTEALGLSEAQRVAIVFSKSHHDWSQFHLYESRSQALGLEQCVFGDFETALAWLRAPRAT